ncbi:hypothetical protein HRS9139_08427 [Pyrenophora teres f. teres]|nr:hypothetical protein HRS9139_08427 [Pyrenophora teres f. teres]
MRLSITLLLTATAVAIAQDTVSAPTGTGCTPHGDHWHCANGVPEPTTPPRPNNSPATPRRKQPRNLPSFLQQLRLRLIATTMITTTA